MLNNKAIIFIIATISIVIGLINPVMITMPEIFISNGTIMWVIGLSIKD